MNNKFNFKPDRTLKQPLYIQLFNELYSMIEKGILKRGEKLPPIRKLRDHLGVNLVTVVSAYKKLEDEDLIYKVPGGGTYVSNISRLNFKNSHFNKSVLVDELYAPDDLLVDSRRRSSINAINFSSTSPSPDLFPLKEFREAINESIENDGALAFGYHESMGNRNLRISISEELSKSNIIADTNDIAIISGTQQGIEIISKTLLRKGDFVLTENPTYSGGAAIFKSSGAALIDIEMTSDGPFMDRLEKNIIKYKPKLLYVIPDYQNPTGISWDLEKRNRILELANKHGFYILEDGYVNELNYTDEINPTLFTLDTFERVIYAKSFSRFLLPGVRLGYMIIPALLKSDVMLTKHITDISSSGLLQNSMNLFIKKNCWENHVGNLKQVFKKRYEKVLSYQSMLAHKNLAFYPPQGGVNIWFKINSSMTSSLLTQKLSKQNILITPGTVFHSNAMDLDKYFRLSFTSTNIDEIETGLKKLLEELN